MTATKEKNLRTGQPVWEIYPAPRVPHHKLTRDIATDILIIGAGITGAMIGEALAGTGLDIVDRGSPPADQGRDHRQHRADPV